MDLTVTIEHRFCRTPDGAVWTKTTFANPFWLRYLDVFDHVRVLARVEPVSMAPTKSSRADSERVSFVDLPYYVGPWQYIQKASQVRHVARSAVPTKSAVIMRVGSGIAWAILPKLRRENRPYGLEIVADPYDVFRPGAIKHPLRALFRRWFTNRLRQMSAGACAIAYVTSHSLQQRYPPGRGAYVTNCSDVELGDDTFISAPRHINMKNGRATLVFVGSLAQMYKAPDVLIDAVGICAAGGMDLRLLMLGDGKHRSEMEKYASSKGLDRRVSFLGQVPSGEAVRAQLDQADIFVLPSRVEALPRAMVEAMARGLPCIGSDVGGIPELLPREDLVPAGDSKALADKIKEILSNPRRMTAMSVRNLEKAREYHDEVLQKRRNAFYQYVREQTEAWLETVDE